MPKEMTQSEKQIENYALLLNWALKEIRSSTDLSRARQLAEAFHDLPIKLSPRGSKNFMIFWTCHIACLPAELRDEVCTYAKELLELNPGDYIKYEPSLKVLKEWGRLKETSDQL